jgi:YVTN family beta-propeller protein
LSGGETLTATGTAASYVGPVHQQKSARLVAPGYAGWGRDRIGDPIEAPAPSARKPTKVDSDSVSKIDPSTNTVTATVTVGDAPFGGAFDGTNIWVTNLNDDTVSKIDPSSNTVIDTVTVGDGPIEVAFDGANIWVTSLNDGTVSKIVPF